MVKREMRFTRHITFPRKIFRMGMRLESLRRPIPASKEDGRNLRSVYLSEGFTHVPTASLHD